MKYVFLTLAQRNEGFYMAETLAVQTEYLIQEQHEKQSRYDFETQFAELVDGSMRTSFELQFNGTDLIGEDGRGMLEISQEALEEAKEMARKDPSLWFEVRRRGFERDEIDEAIRMARGEGPNTMVITSDFPLELMSATKDIGGYNHGRKQTMERVLARKSNGNIQMYSQSLDGSNRPALEAMYGCLGEKPQPGELLPQRRRLDLPETEQTTLIDELRDIYDSSLTLQFGGDWYAGRRPADYRNTHDFVCEQQDLIQECIRLKNLGWLNDNVMYNMSATMQKRFGEDQRGAASVVPGPAGMNPMFLNVLYVEVESAGAQAKMLGKSFSACGVTLDALGVMNSTEDQMDSAGYGNKSDEDKYGSLTFKCQKGHTNKRPRNELLDTCKTCGVSVSCGPSKK
jgi:hypothetical protein